MQAVTGLAMLVVAFAAVAPAHAGSSCPTDTVEGQSLIGSWDGYVLSQVPDGYYTTANMAMVITENSSNQMFATMNLTAPTCSGKGCPSTKQPSGSCVAHFNLTCLDEQHPSDIGFRLMDPVPDCYTKNSPWRCDFLLTGDAYQKEGHPVAFYYSVRYDPTVGKNPMRFEPFGSFVTGCTDSGVQVQFQARAHGVSGQDPAAAVAVA